MELKEGEIEPPITVEHVLELLDSPMKLSRERGVVKLDKLLRAWEISSEENVSRETIRTGKQRLQEAVLNGLLAEEEDIPSTSTRPSSSITEEQTEGSRPISRSNSISEEHSHWEQKHGYLMACYPLISFSNAEDTEFLRKVRDVAITLLTHPRIRVQLAAGGVLGFMSKHAGPSVYEVSRNVVLHLVTENLNTVCVIPEEDELKSAEQGFDVNLPAVVIRQKVIKESLGWNQLEPGLKCLHFMIENLGPEFVPFMEQRILTLTFKCLSHPVRYVRETGFQICNALITAAPEDMREVAHQLSNHLAVGLSDNWNQVRMASAVATRSFFLAYAKDKEEFYPVLLPKLCLNRYYTAEGIRVHIQESWKLIVGTEGRHLVAKYMENIVDCYLKSCNSTNLAERETACACIAELATKIERTAFLPHASSLLEALVLCAKNESWSVRDAACLAIRNFLLHYPQESQSFLPEIYALLFGNLKDPIRLLRQGAATALGNIAEAYGTEAWQVILPELKAGLSGIDGMKDWSWNDSGNVSPQPQDDHETTSRVVHDEDACAQHEPQCEFAVPGKVVVSSESLMRFMAGATSNFNSPCLSCRKSKVPQPWHHADGCLYLVGALASLDSFKGDLKELVPLVLKTTELRNYPEHWTVLETFCKVTPLLGKAIGKKHFKESLQACLEPIIYTVECMNQMISSTGRECVRELAELIGPNILRSRLELYDPKYANLIPE